MTGDGSLRAKERRDQHRRGRLSAADTMRVCESDGGLPPTKVSAGFPRIVQLASFQVVAPECALRSGTPLRTLFSAIPAQRAANPLQGCRACGPARPRTGGRASQSLLWRLKRAWFRFPVQPSMPFCVVSRAFSGLSSSLPFEIFPLSGSGARRPGSPPQDTRNGCLSEVTNA